MKIVNIISCPGTGGAEILVKETLLELSKNSENKLEVWVMSKIQDSNMEATLTKINFEKEYIQELEKAGVKVKFVNKRANKDLIRSWLNIRSLYKEFKPEVIHSHLEQVTIHMLIATLGLNSKKIQTIHNTKIVYPKLQKYFVNYFLNYFVSISPETTKEILSIGIKKEKIKELFNGINTGKFSNFNKKYQKKIRYIAVGRILEQKNYSLMLKSFNAFLINLPEDERINHKLSIVGEGPDKSKIDLLIEKLQLGNNVELLGVRNDIPELLKNSDIYLMSSKWEGFSISLIEAAAAGLPIIATDVGSNSRIVQNEFNGYLINSEDENQFCEALKKINYIKRREIFSKNSIEISKKYDLKNIIQELVKIYKGDIE